MEHRFISESVINSNKRNKEWAEILDWLTDETRFDCFSPRQKSMLTTRMKKSKYFVNNNYHTKMQDIPRKKIGFIIYMTSKEGQSESLIRHIRNGIFHGHAKRKKVKNIEFVEIEDFDRKRNRSAYILVQESFVLELYNLYKLIKVSN